MKTATPSRNLDAEMLNKVAHVLKTIGHPVRLGIMEVLELDEPLSVHTIQSRLKHPAEQSLLSHHLIKMRDTGLLVSHKEGKEIHYAIKDRGILKVFDCMENCTLF